MRIAKEDLQKAQEACIVFGCVPFDIVVDSADCIRVFITPMEHLVKLYHPATTSVGWKMTKQHMNRYYDDLEISKDYDI
jgi:hypothetical protein